LLQSLIVVNCAYALRSYVKARRLGHVFLDGAGYELPNGDDLIPDVSFVRADRLPPALPVKFEGAPDLAIEVFSPSNQEREMLDKAESYLRSGAQLVWIAYPTQQTVDVCTLTDDGALKVQHIAAGGTLNGGDVLPGFTLALSDVFDTSP
jgi:Uma2 family endonuclease